MRKGTRNRKSKVKYEPTTKIRHRGTGNRIQGKEKSDVKCEPVKRKHTHGNVISERQVRKEVRKRLSPIIETVLQQKRKTLEAEKSVRRLKKQLKQRDIKLNNATQHITELSKRVSWFMTSTVYILTTNKFFMCVCSCVNAVKH